MADYPERIFCLFYCTAILERLLFISVQSGSKFYHKYIRPALIAVCTGIHEHILIIDLHSQLSP